MRPNNQSKNRSRGRGNGRKHQNPLSRTYESNGPDVKVRGNAAHVAEKYVQLARDAQASGDSVMAENYLQHAEHYFRIILAAQAQSAARPDASGADNQDDEFADDTTSKAEAAKSEPDEAGETQEADKPAAANGAEPDKEKPRARRPRRRKTAETAEGAEAGEGSDPSKAPQPDVGELPAFLTSGGQSSAAE